jgi:hypothetical protein
MEEHGRLAHADGEDGKPPALATAGSSDASRRSREPNGEPIGEPNGSTTPDGGAFRWTKTLDEQGILDGYGLRRTGL